MAVVRKAINPRAEIAAIARRSVVRHPKNEDKRLPFLLQEIRKHDSAQVLLGLLVDDGARAAINLVESELKSEAHWKGGDSDAPKYDRAAALQREKDDGEFLRLVSQRRAEGVFAMSFGHGIGARKPIGEMVRDEVIACKNSCYASAKSMTTYGNLFAWIEARMKSGGTVAKQVNAKAANEYWDGIKDA